MKKHRPSLPCFEEQKTTRWSHFRNMRWCSVGGSSWETSWSPILTGPPWSRVWTWCSTCL